LQLLKQGKKTNLTDECIFVVLTKKQILPEVAVAVVGGVGGASASGASVLGAGR
jgi:hypothetical protein